MQNEDFVSRQWLIGEYHRRHQGPPGGALKMIEEAPAADVEPVRHGRWINHTEPDQSNNIMCWCSECGAGDQHAVGVEVPYCWKCGAKMQDSTRGKHVGEMLDRIINQYMQHKEEPHD